MDKIDFSGIDKTFILADTNTVNLCVPLVEVPHDTHIITLKAGDINKNIESAIHIWNVLSANGATRHSLLVNIGGGMITDLGGFAASTFKRGIDFVNIPTTLLAMVDASCGGKTGINLGVLKNEVGAFANPRQVLTDVRFLETLPHIELLSGYAEMLKHAVIDSPEMLAQLLDHTPHDIDYASVIERNIMVKREIVMRDPYEKNERRKLNLGHTIGHAIESLLLERNTPVPHGYAVAWGLVGAWILSHMVLGTSNDMFYPLLSYIKEEYGPFPIVCKDVERLMELMEHDKKNRSAKEISFTLIEHPGKVTPGITPPAEQVEGAIEIMCDLLA